MDFGLQARMSGDGAGIYHSLRAIEPVKLTDFMKPAIPISQIQSVCDLPSKNIDQA